MKRFKKMSELELIKATDNVEMGCLVLLASPIFAPANDYRDKIDCILEDSGVNCFLVDIDKCSRYLKGVAFAGVAPTLLYMRKGRIIDKVLALSMNEKLIEFFVRIGNERVHQNLLLLEEHFEIERKSVFPKLRRSLNKMLLASLAPLVRNDGK